MCLLCAWDDWTPGQPSLALLDAARSLDAVLHMEQMLENASETFVQEPVGLLARSEIINL